MRADLMGGKNRRFFETIILLTYAYKLCGKNLNHSVHNGSRARMSHLYDRIVDHANVVAVVAHDNLVSLHYSKNEYGIQRIAARHGENRLLRRIGHYTAANGPLVVFRNDRTP